VSIRGRIERLERRSGVGRRRYVVFLEIPGGPDRLVFEEGRDEPCPDAGAASEPGAQAKVYIAVDPTWI
jgi:hypothetical protein